ncbi:MAG: site-2 protease family protein [Anaerovoracaceae bacterium]
MTASLAKIIIYIIQINLVLMIFNLLPIPPLDGFNLITEIFNLKKYSWWYDIYDKGFIILMVLILFNFTDRILTPCVGFCMDIVSLILML